MKICGRCVITSQTHTGEKTIQIIRTLMKHANVIWLALIKLISYLEGQRKENPAEFDLCL